MEMTWEIVAALIALAGFIITVVKTVVPLTNAVTRLTERIDSLAEQVDEMEGKKSEAHRRLWSHNDTQDAMLQNHEQRLHDLDGKWFER